MRAPPLTGLRVVEVSAFVAAPLAGALLAELGADVVRVDPPGGGIDRGRWPSHAGRSLYWIGLNQGKRSVNVDMRTIAGQSLVADLIVAAGACVTNLADASWLAYERLRRRRPDLIMVVISGNADGSIAVDYTVNAAVGFPWVTGPQDHGGPVNHVFPAWDVTAAHTAVTAFLAAELERVRTNEGSFARISLADAALSTAAHLGIFAEAQLVPEPRGRYGNYVFGTYGRDFATADGRYVMVVALTRRQWRSLISATETSAAITDLERRVGADLESEDARWKHREEISAIIAPWVQQRTLAEVGGQFERLGVLWGPYRTFQQLMAEDPRASTSNPMFAEVEQPGIGNVLTTGSPIFFDGAGRSPARAAPDMGQHTRDVLSQWLGMSATELDQLTASGTIFTADSLDRDR